MKKSFLRQVTISKRCTALFIITVLFSLPGFSQDVSETIRNNFNNYSSQVFQEKVFLHTDKTIYTTGEIIWFKAYNTDAILNKPSSLSRICYVEIIADDNRPMLQGKILLDSGFGNGSFMLPPSIRSGNYLLRAYTNWMKNFDPSYYFEKKITIINAARKPVWSQADTTSTYEIRFFPEGGHLVTGLPGKLAFKITNQFGKGVNANGLITDENNNIVTSFHPLLFGIGNLAFTPGAGHSYKAIIQLDDGTKITRALPSAYSSGWTMQVQDEGDMFIINVQTNNFNEKNIFLFAHTRNVTKLVLNKSLVNGKASFIVDKKDLADGISHLTLFNSQKQPVCERLCFKRPLKLLQVEMAVPTKEYKIRSKINVDVSTKDNGQDISADLSVAVYLVDSLQHPDESSITDFTWLTSELRGTIESPSYYLNNKDSKSDSALDNLLLTHGWSRFKWDDILKNQIPSFTYLPEHEGHLITGTLIPKFSSIKTKGVTAYFSVPGENFRFANAVSNENGNVLFNVPFFYGTHEIVLQTNNIIDSNLRVESNTPFSEKHSETKMPAFNVMQELQNNIITHHISGQVQQIFEPSKRNTFILPRDADTTVFFGIPGKTYYTDDYTRFPTMEEVMKEYVKEVHVRKERDHFRYEVFNEQRQNYFTAEPLILVDGIPVFDIDKIMAVDPLKIKKIEVATRPIFSGPAINNGVVSYHTYQGDLEGYQLDPNAVVISYDGLQLQREFYSPVYEKNNELKKHLPDFRNVLFWSPALKTLNGRGNFSFYSSDIQGKYMVVIQGIDRNGIPGVAMTSFKVNP